MKQIKEFIKDFVVIVFVVGFCVLMFVSFKTVLQDRYYALSGTVWEIDTIEDTVTVRDFSGHLWTFGGGSEDWKIGDIANMIMNNHATDSLYDDQIMKVTYGGSLE